ncbi:hypothetical protein NDU88_009989 [Pleurodeles waltl]|uniref:Uncharacterized protein n=1 Tax=Pleurodeles waltl TaxID=8319 RepID=A0AAV7RWU8_PLEWA|nr:hypothetical protein NDU88_009989 [Pleurodeles waltl]
MAISVPGGNERPAAAEAVTPVVGRVTRTTALTRGMGAKPLQLLYCHTPPAHPQQNLSLLQGPQRKATIRAAILVVGSGGPRLDPGIASIRSLTPWGPWWARTASGWK